MLIIRNSKLRSFVILAAILISLQGKAENIVDYKVDAVFHEKKHLLTVDLQMTLEEVSDYEIGLLFSHYAEIQSLSVSSPEKELVRYRFSGTDSIRLSLPRNINLNKPLTLNFRYSIPVDSLVHSNSSIYGIGRVERWYPLKYNNLSVHKLTIEVPEHYTALSSGDRITDRNAKANFFSWNDRYNFTIPLFIFRTDSLQYFSRNSGGTKIDFFFYTKNQTIQTDISSIVVNSFDYFNNFFGNDYPYSTYSFIEVPDYPAGSATGSLQVYGTLLFADFYKYGKLYSLKPAVHEVAHEWWGIGRMHFKDKTEDKGLQFLRESVNEYLTYMFFEKYWGADSLKSCTDLAMRYYNGYITAENDKAVFDVLQQSTTWEEAVVVYYKGPLIVQKLREMLGDDDFIKFIRYFYSTYRNNYSTYADFEKALSEFDKDGSKVKTLEYLLTTKGIP